MDLRSLAASIFVVLSCPNDQAHLLQSLLYRVFFLTRISLSSLKFWVITIFKNGEI